MAVFNITFSASIHIIGVNYTTSFFVDNLYLTEFISTRVNTTLENSHIISIVWKVLQKDTLQNKSP